jgi:hypothetical protein
VVRLPERIGTFRLPAMHDVKLIAVGFVAFPTECQQRGRDRPYNAPDGVVARYNFTPSLHDRLDFAPNGERRERRPLQCKAFYELRDVLMRYTPTSTIRARPPRKTRKPTPQKLRDPSLRCPHRDPGPPGNWTKRPPLLQMGSKHLVAGERALPRRFIEFRELAHVADPAPRHLMCKIIRQIICKATTCDDAH